jgi:hypothetical protein
MRGGKLKSLVRGEEANGQWRFGLLAVFFESEIFIHLSVILASLYFLTSFLFSAWLYPSMAGAVGLTAGIWMEVHLNS